MKQTFRKRHNLTTLDVVLAVIIAICVLLLVGANLARTEIEKRTIEEQEIYVTPEGNVLVQHKGNVYEKEFEW